jgi:hypothetical protein
MEPLDRLLKNAYLFEDPSSYQAGVRDAIAMFADEAHDQHRQDEQHEQHGQHDRDEAGREVPVTR